MPIILKSKIQDAITRSEWRIIGATGAAHGLVHATMLTFAAVLAPMREEFGAGLFAIAVIGNISYFSFGLLAPVSGILTDRLGARVVLAAGFAGMAAASLTAAAAPNVYVLGGALSALGLAAAVYHPAGLSLIARRVTAVERAMAFHGIFGSLGLAAGPILAGTVAAAAGWRWAYAALAAPHAALAAAFAFGTAKKTSVTEVVTNSPVLPNQTFIPGLLIFYAAAILLGFVFHGATTFFPIYLGTMKNLFVGNAATTFSLLAGVVGQYLGGFVAARWRQELVLASAIALCGVALIVLAGFTGPAMLLPAALFGLAYFATQPASNTLVSRLTAASRQGTAFGVSFFLSFGVGSLGTTFTGFIGEKFHIASAFRLLGFASFVCALLAAGLYLLRVKRRDASQPGFGRFV